MPRRIGITTTVPHEFIVAAGHVPVDLNNVFVATPDAVATLALAEAEGFPPAVCAWIKGIYAAVRAGRCDAVVTVTNGDCANTRALAAVLRHRGVDTIDFAFPPEPTEVAVRRALDEFAQRLGVTWAAAEAVHRQWRPLRRRLAELDELAWRENRITSAELHGWLVSASDFDGDYKDFGTRLDRFRDEVRRREPRPARYRLALLGVPPIFTDLFAAIEARGGHVVFDEVPRQFAMPYDCDDVVEQFRRYTYPYDLDQRLADVTAEVARRGVRAALHYVQAFCHRQIEHIVLRDKLEVPVLAVEGDRPGPVSGQLLTRLDAFLEMLD